MGDGFDGDSWKVVIVFGVVEVVMMDMVTMVSRNGSLESGG